MAAAVLGYNTFVRPIRRNDRDAVWLVARNIECGIWNRLINTDTADVVIDGLNGRQGAITEINDIAEIDVFVRNEGFERNNITGGFGIAFENNGAYKSCSCIDGKTLIWIDPDDRISV